MFDPSRQDFPDFPWKRGSQQRAHDLWRWILIPALPEPLPQEDKWRWVATFPRLERVGNGVWDPPELPGAWDVIKDPKSLDVPSQGFGIPQNFQIFGF